MSAPLSDSPGQAPQAMSSLPAPRGPSTGMLIGIVGGIFVVAGLFCGIGGWLLLSISPSFQDEVRTTYATSPQVVEAIGGIDSISYDALSTWNEKDTGGAPAVFDVRGPKGNAKIVVYRRGDSAELGEHTAYLRQGQADFPLTPSVGVQF